MKLKQNFLTLFFLLFASITLAAQDIPARPQPPRLVNDFTNTLSKSQVNALEQKLVRYNDTTSTQIAVVIVNDLQGTTSADFAYRLGEKWGVGHKENNGAVILIKPKNETKGEVAISVGYGLEPFIPDALTKRIIEKEMIPEFKNNDYYRGIDNAVNTIIGLASGAFSGDEYAKGNDNSILLIPLFIFIFGIFLIRMGSKASYSGKKPNSFWKALFWAALLSSNNRHDHHDNWGGFSGGSGGFGGGGGSFGGFGGGHFGGGGASGSW